VTAVIGNGGQQAVAEKLQVALEAAGRHFILAAIPGSGGIAVAVKA